MKEWTIDIEETQKYLERYSENRYLVESRVTIRIPLWKKSGSL